MISKSGVRNFEEISPLIVIFYSIFFFFFFFLKNWKIYLWKKRRFRLRWDSSPGLLIAGRFEFIFYLNSWKKLSIIIIF